MTLKTGIIAGSSLLVVVVASALFYLNYLDLKAKEEDYFKVINEGFALLESPDTDNYDLAMGKALSAREIIPAGKETYLLEGRAFLLKNQHKKAIAAFNKGLKASKEIDFRNELDYYLGLTYSNLYLELKQEDYWKSAMASFNEALSSRHHKADAYLGVSFLYFAKYRSNPIDDHVNKAAINLERCIKVEDTMEGYEAGKPGSICPLCAKKFSKNSENEKVKKLRAALNER